MGSIDRPTGDGHTAQHLAEWNTDTWKAIGGVLAINDTTPILAALAWLRDHTPLTAAEYKALTEPVPVGVRTLGDLRAVLDRGELDEKLAKKLRVVLG